MEISSIFDRSTDDLCILSSGSYSEDWLNFAGGHLHFSKFNGQDLGINLFHRNIAIKRTIMGATKTDLFNPKQNELANMARAIAHPARIAILQHLIKTDACVCGDLVHELGLAQPTISQHLKELKLAGIIQGSVEGVRICYCIDPKAWMKFREFFNNFFIDLQDLDKRGKCDCC